jgi:hypothetical protein|tara:strand:+ start:4911 stop:5906 length:996 start_codon:yes stop_codon:yes gene_type:complete
MPVAVAPAERGHNVFSNAFRGRNRAISEVGPPPSRGKETAQMQKAASYTYIPSLKDLDQPPVVELKGTISEEDLHNSRNGGRTSGSSGGSSPSSEEAPEPDAVHMPQLRPTNNSRRSSRYFPFSSKSREPSAEPKPDRKADRGRKEMVKQADSPSNSPARSLTKLRRKSYIVSQEQQQQPSSSSPTREKVAEKKDDSAKTSLEATKRKTPTSAVSIPDESEARDTTPELQQPVPLSKKNKRLSGFLNTKIHAPPVPAVPKSFSTDQLPLNPQLQSPLSPANVPPLPRNTSHENFKGVKTEPRKKDELWTEFRTLDADLRKYGTNCPRFDNH